MPLYENYAPLSQLARIGGIKVSAEQKEAMAEHVQKTFPDYTSREKLKALLECTTMGEMLHYFRESKHNGANKEDTNQMAKALLHAETLLGVAPDITSILGSYRSPKPKTTPSR